MLPDLLNSWRSYLQLFAVGLRHISDCCLPILHLLFLSFFFNHFLHSPPCLRSLTLTSRLIWVSPPTRPCRMVQRIFYKILLVLIILAHLVLLHWFVGPFYLVLFLHIFVTLRLIVLVSWGHYHAAVVELEVAFFDGSYFEDLVRFSLLFRRNYTERWNIRVQRLDITILDFEDGAVGERGPRGYLKFVFKSSIFALLGRANRRRIPILLYISPDPRFYSLLGVSPL